uniref:Putative gland protein G17G01 n=1 Tax=Heterodera glycines TaxID=51029 RepID=Q86DF2_HETGL|nr:putative gland protein G17G01 [Heterodera glycines]
MEKIVYLKLLQFVLTLTIIWQLRSLHQFCGTFADPKAFLHDISIGHCKNFTLIGKDSKSGEFSALFDQDKWHNQLIMMSSTNGQLIEEQQHQFMDELATKLPSAGRICIPITISPFDWIFYRIANDRILIDNDILYFSSVQLCVALCLLVPLVLGTLLMLLSVEEYEPCAYFLASYFVFCWCGFAAISSDLLLNWTDLWTCFNFQADHTNMPLATLVLSIVMACSSVFEIFFKNSLFKKRLVNAPAAAENNHHKLRKHYATCAIE